MAHFQAFLFLHMQFPQPEACWFYFSPLTKLLSNNLHMVVEKLENAFLFLVVPPLRLCPPPCLLCWNTLTCTRLDVQCAYLSSVSWELQPVPLVSSTSALPTAPDWQGAGFRRPE